MAKPFDASGKQLIEWRPADWLVLAGLPVPASAADVTLVDADLSAVTASVDKLIRVVNVPGGPYLAHVELQSGPDPRLDERVQMYNALPGGTTGCRSAPSCTCCERRPRRRGQPGGLQMWPTRRPSTGSRTG